MRIAVGSTREPEIAAVKEVWELLSGRLQPGSDEPAEFLCYDISREETGTPFSAAELMMSAQTRVENLTLQLKRERGEAEFYIGLVGGFNVVGSAGPRRKVFLESWAYVSDGHKGHFGHGGGMPIPPRIADPVIERGIELEIVIDRFTHSKGIARGQDLREILTDDILTGKQSFVTALILAFAPFYNPLFYGS